MAMKVQAKLYRAPSGDRVAKLFVALRERNNRIRLNASLNQLLVCVRS
jgi:hypothetical protein